MASSFSPNNTGLLRSFTLADSASPKLNRRQQARKAAMAHQSGTAAVAARKLQRGMNDISPSERARLDKEAAMSAKPKPAAPAPTMTSNTSSRTPEQNSADVARMQRAFGTRKPKPAGGGSSQSAFDIAKSEFIDRNPAWTKAAQGGGSQEELKTASDIDRKSLNEKFAYENTKRKAASIDPVIERALYGGENGQSQMAQNNSLPPQKHIDKEIKVQKPSSPAVDPVADLAKKAGRTPVVAPSQSEGLQKKPRQFGQARNRRGAQTGSPQGNFENRMRSGQPLSRQEINQARRFARSKGMSFDSRSGYSNQRQGRIGRRRETPPSGEFEAFVDQQMALSGSPMISGDDRKSGAVYQQGPWKGMTQAEGFERDRQTFASMSPAQRKQYRSRANKTDIRTPRERRQWRDYENTMNGVYDQPQPSRRRGKRPKTQEYLADANQVS